MPLYHQPNGNHRKQLPRSILVVAHPGHELRVHGWLETTLPKVWILTDGSGRSQHSRLDSTTRVLEAIGATSGPVYGRMSDADLYQAVLSCDHSHFIDLVDHLTDALIKDEVECIAGDAEEGYNPAHDICRLIINSAVRLVKRKTNKQIQNYDFTLIGPPGRCPEELRAQSHWLNLDEAAFARKVSAARNYPELQAEVEAALKGSGNEPFRQHMDLVQRSNSDYGTSHEDNFRVECLRPVSAQTASTVSFNGNVPFYEAYGEKQVIAGYYTHVLRYREHMLPLAAALDAHVERT